MVDTVIVALITGSLSLIGTLCGAYWANRKSAAVMEFRLQELEKKVDQHNNLIDRMYDAEAHIELLGAESARHNERLKIVEKRVLENDK